MQRCANYSGFIALRSRRIVRGHLHLIADASRASGGIAVPAKASPKFSAAPRGPLADPMAEAIAQMLVGEVLRRLAARKLESTMSNEKKE